MLQRIPAKLVRSFQVKIKLFFISLVRYNLTEKLKVNPNVRNKFGFINGRNLILAYLIAIGNLDVVGWPNQTDWKPSGLNFTRSHKPNFEKGKWIESERDFPIHNLCDTWNLWIIIFPIYFIILVETCHFQSDFAWNCWNYM